jgi:hypothetical protein
LAAIGRTVGLDDGRAAFYYDLIVSRLNDATRLALEELMVAVLGDEAVLASQLLSMGTTTSSVQYWVELQSLCSSQFEQVAAQQLPVVHWLPAVQAFVPIQATSRSIRSVLAMSLP